MATRGQRPKPTRLKKLEGTFRKDRSTPHEAKVAPAIPPAPASVRENKRAYEFWKRISPELKRVGLLAVLDGAALEGLCLSYSRANEADEDIRKNGIVTRNKWEGAKANPAVSISRASWAEVRHFLTEFGLTPASRSRVDALPVESEQAKGEVSARDFLFGRVVGAISPQRA